MLQSLVTPSLLGQANTYPEQNLEFLPSKGGMGGQNRKQTSDLHPDKKSVNNGGKKKNKLKNQEVILEEPEVKLQLWAPDVTCALSHEGGHKHTSANQ